MLHANSASTLCITDLASCIHQQQADRLQCPLDKVKKTRFSYWSTIVANSKADDSRYANVCNKKIPV